jgi:cytoskeletal protein RodZ
MLVVQMSVGARLARAREQRGLSIEQVATLTKLRVSHITKIEADDFAGADAEVFIRAHLRVIAVAVGEDPADILREYSSDQTLTLSPSTLPQNENRDLNIFERRKTEALPRPKNFTVPLIIAAIVLFIGVLIATQSLKAEELRVNPTASNSVSVTPSKSPTAEESPSESASDVIDPSVVTVTITARQTSWLRVLASSGEELFQRNLVAGESFTFTDLTSINVRVGFPPGLDFSINGVFVGPLGDGSSVADETFVVGQTQPVA